MYSMGGYQKGVLGIKGKIFAEAGHNFNEGVLIVTAEVTHINISQ